MRARGTPQPLRRRPTASGSRAAAPAVTGSSRAPTGKNEPRRGRRDEPSSRARRARRARPRSRRCARVCACITRWRRARGEAPRGNGRGRGVSSAGASGEGSSAFLDTARASGPDTSRSVPIDPDRLRRAYLMARSVAALLRVAETRAPAASPNWHRAARRAARISSTCVSKTADPWRETTVRCFWRRRAEPTAPVRRVPLGPRRCRTHAACRPRDRRSSLCARNEPPALVALHVCGVRRRATFRPRRCAVSRVAPISRRVLTSMY